jgi:hypothetical protein
MHLRNADMTAQTTRHADGEKRRMEFIRSIREAVEDVRDRPETRRGPYRISDAELSGDDGEH